jgi:hypothetical protein
MDHPVHYIEKRKDAKFAVCLGSAFVRTLHTSPANWRMFCSYNDVTHTSSADTRKLINLGILLYTWFNNSLQNGVEKYIWRQKYTYFCKINLL